MITLEEFTQKVESNGYSEVNAKRALGQLELGKKDKAAARKVVESHFKNGNGESKKTNKKIAKKSKKRRPSGSMHGANGLSVNGEGDCFAVTMCEIACNPIMRDPVNRLLSQAREENVPIPAVSARFARMCKAVDKL